MANPFRVFFVIAVFGFAPSVFAFPCTLTQGDLESLSHPACRKPLHDCKPITSAELGSLPVKRQQDVCTGRKFYNVVHARLAKGEKPEQIAASMTSDDFPSGLSRYVTEGEYQELAKVIAAVLADRP